MPDRRNLPHGGTKSLLFSPFQFGTVVALVRPGGNSTTKTVLDCDYPRNARPVRFLPGAGNHSRLGVGIARVGSRRRQAIAQADFRDRSSVPAQTRPRHHPPEEHLRFGTGRLDRGATARGNRGWSAHRRVGPQQAGTELYGQVATRRGGDEPRLPGMVLCRNLGNERREDDALPRGLDRGRLTRVGGPIFERRGERFERRVPTADVRRGRRPLRVHRHRPKQPARAARKPGDAATRVSARKSSTTASKRSPTPSSTSSGAWSTKLWRIREA